MKVIEFRTDHRDHATSNIAGECIGEQPSRAQTIPGSVGSPGRAEKQPASRSFGAWILVGMLRFYIACLSPVFGGACKFYPSCSNYAVEAISKHGARRGFVLAAERLLRCRPFTQGGFDPVPDDVPHAKHGKHGNRKLQVVSGTELKIRATERRML